MRFLVPGGAMTIQKRDRVVCVANKRVNLYVLNGSTVRTETKSIWVPKVRRGAVAGGELDVAIKDYKSNQDGDCSDLTRFVVES